MSTTKALCVRSAHGHAFSQLCLHFRHCLWSSFLGGTGVGGNVCWRMRPSRRKDTNRKTLNTAFFLQYLYAVRLTCRKSVPVCILPSAWARLYVDILTMFCVFRKGFLWAMTKMYTNAWTKMRMRDTYIIYYDSQLARNKYFHCEAVKNEQKNRCIVGSSIHMWGLI